jgi:hypothetical protein
MLACADLGGADLRGADLTGAWLMEAIITGANLQETRRSEWFIEGIICEKVYWGAKSRNYKAGEFEQQHASVQRKRFVKRIHRGRGLLRESIRNPANDNVAQ